MKILVFNAGSSSLKFELFSAAKNKTPRSLFEGHFDNFGKPINNFNQAVNHALNQLKQNRVIKDLAAINAVGYRVVHGGDIYSKPVLITPETVKIIKKFSRLAPLHNGPNLACILACGKIFKNVPQAAVFDTAFHQTMPEKAFIYGLPYALCKKLRIRRYGFHGSSHQYVFEQTRKKLGAAAVRRTITCHLGNGCSIAAILNGKVIDTSMGFTPLEGVPMGTRSGDIDPAIVFYLMENKFSAAEISELLNKKSGLFGVSELSSDVRTLWAQYKKGNKKAIRALEWFAYRIAKYIGAYRAALQGLDCIVFTGGIGENAWYLRKWIMSYFKDFPLNRVLVIPTDEELKIAQETAKLIRRG